MRYAIMAMSIASLIALPGCSKANDRSVSTPPGNDSVEQNIAPSIANEVAAPSAGQAKEDEVSTPAEVGPSSAVYGDCYLKIGSRLYLDIRKTCPIFPLQDDHGGLILNSDGEHPVKGYFVYLTPNGDGTAGATWNEEPGISHAQALLSEKLRRDGACWYDDRVRICAKKR